jgi:hypothetical protein
VAHPTQSIAEFLSAFERTENPHQIAQLASCFADPFLAASPGGAVVVSAADFALALPRRRKIFDELGCRSTRLASIVETKLDDRYVLVETKWLMVFARGEGQTRDILVGSTFILDTMNSDTGNGDTGNGDTGNSDTLKGDTIGGLKVIFYLNHQDVIAILREGAAS